MCSTATVFKQFAGGLDCWIDLNQEMVTTVEQLDATQLSNGYEAIATEFMQWREQSRVGVKTILEWSHLLPKAGSILDLGCGSGVPLSTALSGEGFVIYGIDASPTLIGAFRHRLPDAHCACETVVDSAFFNQTFDGVLAVGMMFLLSGNEQQHLIEKIASVLKPEGRFLFTSPAERCTWIDMLTGKASRSLGAEKYKALLANAGLTLVGEYQDEGENHYYDTRLLSR